ncbi:MAG: aldo/keto reductase [Kiritimatiellae bacterium]|nr:aldo/keto reductase [Kiritimatiellia bacterium]
MDNTHLGRSGLKVSRLCLGTMNFGWKTGEEDSFAIMDKALELGLNFFDTADVYGWQRGEGLTEQILGCWFAQGGRRDRVVLATKVYGAMDPKERPDPNLGNGLSKRKIIQGCEGSLRRLQTDRIDLYQMHHIDRTCPWDEIWEAMQTLMGQGKVLYVGSSNFAGWDIASACQTASRRNLLGPISEQSVYNLDNRMVELEVLPACRHYGLGVIPWSPLGGGLLAGVLRKQDGDRRMSDDVRKVMGEKRARIEKYESFCEARGEAPAHVALAWLLHNPAVTAPIIGPRTMDQLTGALRALEIKLDEGALKTLDEIWPGPGGEAPNAYAW